MNLEDFLQSHGYDLLHISVTLFGAAAMYVYSSFKGFENSMNFLKRMIPNKSETFYFRSDFLLVSVSGAIIGLITFSPQSVYQALAAGFGWTGAMNVLLKTDLPHQPPQST